MINRVENWRIIATLHTIVSLNCRVLKKILNVERSRRFVRWTVWFCGWQSAISCCWSSLWTVRSADAYDVMEVQVWLK